MNYKSFYLTAVLLFFKFSLIAQACNSSSIDSINSCSSYTWSNGVTYTSSNNSAKDTFIPSFFFIVFKGITSDFLDPNGFTLLVFGVTF